MFRFVCERSLPFSTKAELGFLRFFSTPSRLVVSGSGFDKKENGNSFTVSYLISTYELPPTLAVSVSSKLQIQNTERPDSVLALLKSHGFTKPQIVKIIRKQPWILLCNADKTLLPKINFLSSIGSSRTDVAKILSNTALFSRSLEMYFIPRYNFLKNVVHDDKRVVSFLKRSSFFQVDIKKNGAPNIAFLREVGVPEPLIKAFVGNFSASLFTKHDIFRKHVYKIVAMGFSPLKVVFCCAIQTLCSMKQSTWDQKVKIYESRGLSQNQIQLAFKMHPYTMKLSGKKIMTVMDFFVNTLGWEPTTIAKNPTVLFYNLEKRIVPRCMVIRVLSLKGYLKKDLSPSTILQCAEKKFLAEFVTKYIKDVPELLSIYEGKMDLEELDSCKETHGMKHL